MYYDNRPAEIVRATEKAASPKYLNIPVREESLSELKTILSHCPPATQSHQNGCHGHFSILIILLFLSFIHHLLVTPGHQHAISLLHEFSRGDYLFTYEHTVEAISCMRQKTKGGKRLPFTVCRTVIYFP